MKVLVVLVLIIICTEKICDFQSKHLILTKLFCVRIFATTYLKGSTSSLAAITYW